MTATSTRSDSKTNPLIFALGSTFALLRLLRPLMLLRERKSSESTPPSVPFPRKYPSLTSGCPRHSYQNIQAQRGYQVSQRGQIHSLLRNPKSRRSYSPRRTLWQFRLPPGRTGHHKYCSWYPGGLPKKIKRIVGIAGGSGITPLYQVFREIASMPG